MECRSADLMGYNSFDSHLMEELYELLASERVYVMGIQTMDYFLASEPILSHLFLEDLCILQEGECKLMV